ELVTTTARAARPFTNPRERARARLEQSAAGNVSRRGLLGAAAMGASGLALMQAAAAAERNDEGHPGEGGYGRNSVQLPPGAKVAYHDPKDIAAMPEFKYSLDGGVPKITSGGWAKESTIHQLPA